MMAELVSGLFTNSKLAGNAVAELKQRGYTDDISVVAKDDQDLSTSSHDIKQDLTDGTVAGAATGGAIGVVTGLLAGVVSLVLPGVGPLIVAGPLAATWGIAGGALGALAGGIVGALVDAGIPEEKAKMYEDRIKAGDVLVTVETDDAHVDDVKRILESHSVQQSETLHNVAV